MKLIKIIPIIATIAISSMISISATCEESQTECASSDDIISETHNYIKYATSALGKDVIDDNGSKTIKMTQNLNNFLSQYEPLVGIEGMFGIFWENGSYSDAVRWASVEPTTDEDNTNIIDTLKEIYCNSEMDISPCMDESGYYFEEVYSWFDVQDNNMVFSCISFWIDSNNCANIIWRYDKDKTDELRNSSNDTKQTQINTDVEEVSTEQNKRTCAAKARDCSLEPVDGADYCKYHICNYKECKNETVYLQCYCAEHKCSYEDCSSAKKEGADYCDSHNEMMQIKNLENSASAQQSNQYNHTPTLGEENALRQAYNYLDFTAFSKSGLIEQLKFEGYSSSEAEYAVENCGADWNEQAAIKAQEYLNYSAFSRSGLIDQLVFEGFTYSQAEYGVKSVGY